MLNKQMHMLTKFDGIDFYLNICNDTLFEAIILGIYQLL